LPHHHRGHSALLTIDVQRDFTLMGAPAEIPGTLHAVQYIHFLVHGYREQGYLFLTFKPMHPTRVEHLHFTRVRIIVITLDELLYEGKDKQTGM
jgi:hypothetical protein